MLPYSSQTQFPPGLISNLSIFATFCRHHLVSATSTKHSQYVLARYSQSYFWARNRKLIVCFAMYQIENPGFFCNIGQNQHIGSIVVRCRAISSSHKEIADYAYLRFCDERISQLILFICKLCCFLGSCLYSFRDVHFHCHVVASYYLSLST